MSCAALARTLAAAALTVGCVGAEAEPERALDLTIHRVALPEHTEVTACALSADGKTAYFVAAPRANVGAGQAGVYAASIDALSPRRLTDAVATRPQLALCAHDQLALGDGTSLKTWRIDDRQPPQMVKLPSHSPNGIGSVTALAGSPGTSSLFVACDSGVSVVDPVKRTVAKRYEMKDLIEMQGKARKPKDLAAPVLSGRLALSPDGKRLVAMESAALACYRVAGNELAVDVVAPSEGIASVAFSDDSHYLAAGLRIYRSDDLLKPVLAFGKSENLYALGFGRLDEVLLGSSSGVLATYAPQGQPLKRYDALRRVVGSVHTILPIPASHSAWIAGDGGIAVIVLPEVK